MNTENQASMSISVVIPLYNKERHIESTIRSVMAQTQAPTEVIVVDDGSTDQGPERVLAMSLDSVRLLRQPNQGVSAARNRGVQAASGDIVAFIDADDSWEPHFIAEMLALAERYPEAGCFASAYQFKLANDQYLDPKLRFPDGMPQAGLLTDYFAVGARGDLPFMMSSFCLKRALFPIVGPFPIGEPMGEDQEVFARAALYSKIAYTPSVLAFYHLDTTNRACQRHVPTEECPFSRRLAQAAARLDEREQEALRAQLLDYTAAHLLHLVSQNVHAGNWQAVRHLLSDPRCKRRRLRYLWWRLRGACRFFRASAYAGVRAF